jgi:hypothetical protein
VVETAGNAIAISDQRFSIPGVADRFRVEVKAAK